MIMNMNARFDVKALWDYVKAWSITYHIIFVLFVLILPIFIGYDNGKLVWDSSYRSSWFVIPIGLIVALVLLIFSLFKNVRNNYKYLLVVFCSTIVSYLLSYDTRTLIVGAQIILLISTVEALDWLFKRNEVNWKQIQEYLFFIVLFVVVVKFYTDIYHYFSYFVYEKAKIPGHPDASFKNLAGLYQNAFSNPVFFNNNIFIYNYYDYFQLIYILGVFLSLRHIKKYPLLIIILLLLIVMYLYYSTSRLWGMVLLIMPVLYFGASLNIRFHKVFLLFVFGWVMVVGLSGYLYEGINLGKSLNLRMKFISEFFVGMDVNTFLFPRLNPDHSAINASMHNEFLEVWFRCGIAAALAFWWWGYEKLKEVAIEDNMLSVLLLFILIFGGIIQLNFLHLYTMLLLSIFISASRVKVRHDNLL